MPSTKGGEYLGDAQRRKAITC